MNRWLVGLLMAVAGLLAALLVVVLGLVRGGIPVQLAGPVALDGPVGVRMEGRIALLEPIAVDVVELKLDLPQRITVEAAPSGIPVRAAIEGLTCPNCGQGLLVPVRWNLITGEITWRCTSCGHTVP